MSEPSVRPGGTVMELVAPHVFAPTLRPVPEPAAGEVVVAMRALGLCGTDLHMYGGRAVEYPHVVGHDGAAVVTARGAGVTGVAVGERVTIDPVAHCGQCAACTRGATQLCPDGGYLGMLGPGLLAEYVCVPARLLVPLPDAVSDLAATVLEPVAVALHLLARVAPLLPKEPVPCAVVGGGPLGILLGVVLRHHGYAPHLFEPQETRRDLAAAVGLVAHPPEPIDLGDGPRLVVETSAAPAGVALADELATPGSVVAVVGRAPHSIAPPSVLLKELSLIGVKGGPGQYPEAVRLVADGVVDPETVVTHRFGWHEAAEAFRISVDRPDLVVRTALVGAWR
ncbi:L-gulonate 5-dehydrogenase [Streptomyces sp. yr375]|uniref:zinc-dependent alcohol dehydrogenase n=1 Tax=Streptomyces sp. yr375 TaxID=1761906 RepID=UPI0008B73AA9|nr:alcohol dehydrogenase catalytic domain-containing protein [Streptomyces sp. yr375]SEP63964.1 L-gulonate 5-dehydrogenase [Streptomyces sp. yr375]